MQPILGWRSSRVCVLVGIRHERPCSVGFGCGAEALLPRAQFGHQQCYLLVFCIPPITDCIKGWDILPDPDVPPPVPCKKRSIQHRELCRCRCSRVALRRSTSFWGPARREACLFVLAGFACRLKSPVEGVLGTNMVCPACMQPSWLAEYSQKCTALPRGPVRAAKTMPTFLSASPFCCTDFSECRARIS